MFWQPLGTYSFSDGLKWLVPLLLLAGILVYVYTVPTCDVVYVGPEKSIVAPISFVDGSLIVYTPAQPEVNGKPCVRMGESVWLCKLSSVPPGIRVKLPIKTRFGTGEIRVTSG